MSRTACCATAFGIAALGLGTARFRAAVHQGRRRLAGYPARTVHLPSGDVAYVETGDPAGVPLVVLHGMFGGYDQGSDIGLDIAPGCRVVAPSRLGYPGTPVRGGSAPGDQARVVVELLDALGIDRAYVLGASAGGTSAIRFALDHPDRTLGVVLLSAAMPCPAHPARCPRREGPPRALCTDLAMWLLSPLFRRVLGMPAAVVGTMMPVAERRAGVLLDAEVHNPDMARRFDDYPVERLHPPVLVLQAHDDRLARFDRAVAVLPRFPRVTFVPFPDGGHLVAGHGDRLRAAVADFVSATTTPDRSVNSGDEPAHTTR